MTEPMTDPDRAEFLKLWEQELKPATEQMLPETAPAKMPFLVQHIAWKAWRKARGAK